MDRRLFLNGLGACAPALIFGATPARAENALPAAAPIHVRSVGIRARDAEKLARWYETNVGLRVLHREGAVIRLGTAQTLLSITQDKQLTLARPDQPGLYHTAFLLPQRADLGRWLLHAMNNRFVIDGAADHIVSDALYLTDPEGNGVEICFDQPQATWQWENGKVLMGSRRLDAQAIVNAIGMGPRTWSGAPEATMVGHVHLKVGNATRAAGWWRDQMGFEQVRLREGAVFLSTGRYHHHVAVNEWVSPGTSARPDHMTGLDYVELARAMPAAPQTYVDDWGTTVRLV